MTDTITPRGAPRGPGEERDGEEPVDTFKVWTGDEVQAWRRRNPPLSPWRVVAVQVVAGLVCSGVVWAVTRRDAAAWSALYGAAAVVVPSALLARGMARDLGNGPGAAGSAALRFMFWELIKIGVAVAMLVAAPRVVPDLSWPALLVAMIVVVKMNWWALLWRRRPVAKQTKQRV